jgi:dihydroxyacid dehydratase/phosphogluconate dehydratase
LVEDGDKISINSENKTIDWLVDEEEKTRRREAWDKTDKKNLNVHRGVLYRYARDVAVRALHAGFVEPHADFGHSPQTWVLTATKTVNMLSTL